MKVIYSYQEEIRTVEIVSAGFSKDYDGKEYLDSGTVNFVPADNSLKPFFVHVTSSEREKIFDDLLIHTGCTDISGISSGIYFQE
ncbi:MAG: hypothetical protein K2K02_03415 [Ruminococcus sp.]|nr:hypothetical protein [Ruminococcus sp.]